jgi:hypothetical protein
MVTLCSPDPQAIRPPGENANVLQVTLPTNFKVARFNVERADEIIRRLRAKSVPHPGAESGDGARRRR